MPTYRLPTRFARFENGIYKFYPPGTLLPMEESEARRRFGAHMTPVQDNDPELVSRSQSGKSPTGDVLASNINLDVNPHSTSLDESIYDDEPIVAPRKAMKRAPHHSPSE